MQIAKECDILIIGGGLTGVCLAYLLKDKNLNVIIAEARNRIGGRIHTIEEDGHVIEMGATWLGSKHTELKALLNQLNIETYNQKIGSQAIYEAISTSPPYLASLPPNPDPTLRIQGGSMSLIKTLARYIDKENIITDEKITAINSEENHVIVFGSQFNYKAKKVFSTLPPNLLINKISIQPKLPEIFIKLSKSTHTWMGESIKIALSYKTPFWRKSGSSGTIISNVGPIPEMYDHSNFTDNSFSLMGFLNGNYHIINKERRQALVLRQLNKYYGEEANNFQNYYEQVWNKETETYCPYETSIVPHQNNGHELFQKSYLANRLMIGGTETASQHPGYMEGAIVSAKHGYNWIINNQF